MLKKLPVELTEHQIDYIQQILQRERQFLLECLKDANYSQLKDAFELQSVQLFEIDDIMEKAKPG